MKRTRREILAAGASVLAAGGFAGCLDSSGGAAADSDGGPTAQTSFFVLDDVARRVGGDAMQVENVVPFGQHGHGWEPSTSVQQEVFTADAFVYAGDGFQPWADDIVENVRHDDVDTRIIEAREGVELLAFDESGDHDDGDDHEHDDEHDGHEDHSHGENHDDGHDHDDRDDGHGDQDRSGSDPHFWLDPIRLKTTVENVEHGFEAVDPNDEAVYGENATELKTALDELDETFEERLAGAEQDAVVVAGHNSFRYLGHRYGFEVYSLTGIAPDAEPSGRDIARAQEVIDEHGIEYVLWPALESDRAAETLVDETDVRDALPITAIAGLTDEWQEKEWGYLDVMEEVNLASLETALGAT